jgi:F0F1-type ATP synthase assembly protein I
MLNFSTMRYVEVWWIKRWVTLNKKEDNFEKKLKSWGSRHGKEYQTYIKTSAVGLEFGLAIAIGAVLGYLVDKYFHFSPYGLIIGVLFGAAAGIKRLYTFTKSYVDKNKDHHDHNQ